MPLGLEIHEGRPRERDEGSRGRVEDGEGDEQDQPRRRSGRDSESPGEACSAREHERGLLFKDREFQGVLRPGRHFVWDLLWKVRADVVSVRDVWLDHLDLDVIAKSGALGDEAKVLDLKDHERAVVWVDGRVEAVLRAQLEAGLAGTASYIGDGKVVLGYEPVWAIGPGKTPPGRDYIAFVSQFIKRAVQEIAGHEALVVYGGGLKEENAGMVGSIATIDGGLVALTRFSGEIGFSVDELKTIVEKYGSDRSGSRSTQ